MCPAVEHAPFEVPGRPAPDSVLGALDLVDGIVGLVGEQADCAPVVGFVLGDVLGLVEQRIVLQAAEGGVWRALVCLLLGRWELTSRIVPIVIISDNTIPKVR